MVQFHKLKGCRVLLHRKAVLVNKKTDDVITLLMLLLSLISFFLFILEIYLTVASMGNSDLVSKHALRGFFYCFCVLLLGIGGSAYERKEKPEVYFIFLSKDVPAETLSVISREYDLKRVWVTGFWVVKGKIEQSELK